MTPLQTPVLSRAPKASSAVFALVLQGIFDLNELRVGRGAVLRANTRLLSGASMRPFSTILKHTLVVS